MCSGRIQMKNKYINILIPSPKIPIVFPTFLNISDILVDRIRLNMENNIHAKLSKIENNLKLILEVEPRLRNSEMKKELFWEYWKRFDGLCGGITKEMWLYRITNPEYLGRALRKVMVKVKEVDNPQRYEEEKDFLKTYPS